MLRRAAYAIFVLAALVGLGMLLWPAPAPKDRPQAEFLLLDGGKTSLAELRGKPVLVAFWATSCKPCVEELPDLIKLYGDLHPRGFELIAVAMPYDPPLTVQTFVREKQVPYPVAVDVEGKVVRAFDGVPYVPMAFLIAPDGKIAYQQVGRLDIAKARRIIERRVYQKKIIMLWLKALHIIFMVTWFAGLFYLPRLFVYHAMSGRPDVSRERFKIMERKLFYGIMTPGAVLTIVFGAWLWLGYGVSGGWLHAKLALVAALIAYHIYCGKLLVDFKHDRNRHSHVWYRWFNELPVLILVAVVILAVAKPF